MELKSINEEMAAAYRAAAKAVDAESDKYESELAVMDCAFVRGVESLMRERGPTHQRHKDELRSVIRYLGADAEQMRRVAAELDERHD